MSSSGEVALMIGVCVVLVLFVVIVVGLILEWCAVVRASKKNNKSTTNQQVNRNQQDVAKLYIDQMRSDDRLNDSLRLVENIKAQKPRRVDNTPHQVAHISDDSDNGWADAQRRLHSLSSKSSSSSYHNDSGYSGCSSSGSSGSSCSGGSSGSGGGGGCD